MALSSAQKQEIVTLLQKKLNAKLKKYSRESVSMPFLTRIIQDSEKVAAYSFIHSIATTLGMSIYEEVSCIIARPHCIECARNVKMNGTLSNAQKTVVSNIVGGLRDGTRNPNIVTEISEVLRASSAGGKTQKDGNIADFYLKKSGVEYYFEIKTVKPNIDVFEKSKRKLLEWIARKRTGVKVFLAFPYNPYHPQPYERFTVQNMMDHPNDFLIGDEYWDFLGGRGTMRDLLQVFDEVGKDYSEKIAQKIQEVANRFV